MEERTKPLAPGAFQQGLEAFLQALAAYSAPLVFNPWRDWDAAGSDIGPAGVELRRANLRRYLGLRRQARYLFIAEALGYQGGHFSGLALTSERILLGYHPGLDPAAVLGEGPYARTSNPASPLLNRSQRQRGFNEPSDTVVWEALAKYQVAPREVILWNIFPFHPYKEGRLLSNRTPTGAELAAGLGYAQQLLGLVPGLEIVAIGRKAAATLAGAGLACAPVRHPSMGGASLFKAAVGRLFGEKASRLDRGSVCS